MKYKEKFFNKNDLKDIFSFDGLATSPMIMWVMSLIYLCNTISQQTGIPLFSYIVKLLLFYPAFAVIQRRSRDAGMKGTFFIVCYSICLIMSSAEHFVKIPHDIIIRQYVGHITSFFYLMILFLFIIPSKKEADLSLRSPLLKYPLIYTVVCWIIAIMSTFLVNSYF